MVFVLNDLKLLKTTNFRALRTCFRTWPSLRKNLRVGTEYRSDDGFTIGDPLVRNVLSDVSDHVKTARIQPCIHSLPPEILGEIFIHCLSSEDTYLYVSICEAPMLLCQVCSYWRKVALSMAFLWSSFTCYIGEETRPSHALLFQLWLERSRAHRLSLALLPDEHAGATTKILLANVHRWHDVHVVLDAELGAMLSGILAEDVPELESINMMVRSGNWDIDRLFSNLNSFPSLRRIVWEDDYVPPSLINMPWPRLTNLKMTCYISSSECITLLSHMPSVEHVFIRFITPPSPDSLSSSAITIVPHLRSLSVRIDTSGIILDYLTLPSLTSLKASQPNDPHIFRRFVERSRCNLDAFQMTTDGLEDEEVLFYLQLSCMQSLKSLELALDAVTDKLATFLTWSGSSKSRDEYVLPNLTDLRLTVNKTTDGVLGKMLASRWFPENPPTRLPASLRHADLEYSVCSDEMSIESGIPPSELSHNNKVKYATLANTGKSESESIEYHRLDIACFERLVEEGLDVSWRCLCDL